MEPAFADEAVHDLKILRVAGGRSQQPIAPPRSFFGVALLEEDIEREGCIAQPAVPVVPVSWSADLLGERCGRGRNDATAGSKSEGFESKEASHNLLPPTAIVRTTTRPLLPESRRVDQQVVAVAGLPRVSGPM